MYSSSSTAWRSSSTPRPRPAARRSSVVDRAPPAAAIRCSIAAASRSLTSERRGWGTAGCAAGGGQPRGGLLQLLVDERDGALQSLRVPRPDAAVGQLCAQRVQGLLPSGRGARMLRAHDAFDDPLGRLGAHDAGADVGAQAARRGACFVRALPAGPVAVAQQPAGRRLPHRVAAPLARCLQRPFGDAHPATVGASLTLRPRPERPVPLARSTRRNVTDVPDNMAMPGGVSLMIKGLPAGLFGRLVDRDA